jgi:NAD+ diphosphatase
MSASLNSTFVRAYPPAQPASGSALYLPFRGTELVVQEVDNHEETELESLPVVALLKEPWNRSEEGTLLYLGTLDGIPCLTYRIPADSELPTGYKAMNIRALYGLLDETTYGLTGYASQLIHWWEDHRYCSHCQGKLAGMAERGRESTWGKLCEQCERPAYPPVVPAILLLIHDGAERTLLVSKPGWGKRFSIVAGFVEPGESLEACCVREAEEEVGVTLTDVTYFGSQSWPFPHQIMIGFMAQYVSGEIRLDETELAQADWFHYREMPELPPPLSLSRQIIDAWVSGHDLPSL